ncbi:hypothetical protein KBZ21_41800, partial [Streptomyces sp. A73]|nr:hypothetical protein [Streptomyces sp. A73]
MLFLAGGLRVAEVAVGEGPAGPGGRTECGPVADDKKPGTQEARGMLNEYKKEWARRVGVKKAPAITDTMLRAMV